MAILFYIRYIFYFIYRIRVEHMECDTTAWKESCHKVTVGLKNEFQCAMLPSVCHNITEIDDILHNKVCKREAYLQALRSPYSSATPVFTSWVIPSIVTAALSLFIIFWTQYNIKTIRSSCGTNVFIDLVRQSCYMIVYHFVLSIKCVILLLFAYVVGPRYLEIG